MSERTIRIGVIGAGANTRERHIPGLQAIPGVRVLMVCNRSRESAARVAEQFDIPQVCDRWNQVIEDERIDAVVIGTWPNLHAPATIAALEAGKHVLVEARMALNAAEARAMAATAVRRPGLVAQVVPSPVTLAVDPAIRRLLAEGFIDEPLAIEIRQGDQFLDRDAPLHWRQDFDLSGFNTMALGIWYEALLRWVGEATRVSAMGRTFVRQRRGADGRLRAVRVPDHLDVLAEMACGAQAHIRMSSVTGLAGSPEAVLFGSEGTLRFDGTHLWGARRDEPKLKKIEIPKDERGRWRVEEEFIGAIRGQEPIRLTTFGDGVKYMEFTEAVARAIAEGLVIPLPL